MMFEPNSKEPKSRGGKKRYGQEQEALVIQAAIECVEETSLLDFTMASIAKRADISIGSLYKHVQSKEDVLVAIAVQMMSRQREVFAGVMGLPLSMPERLIGCVLLSPERLYQHSFGAHLEMLTGNLAILNRASSRWLHTLGRVDESIGQVFEQALSDGWQSGELRVPEEDRDAALEQISVGLWSMSVGFFQVAYQRQARHQDTSKVPLPFPLAIDHPIVRSTVCLINAHPWKSPLDDEGLLRARDLLKEKGYR